MKNCLIILGMHKLGTSVFTGVLELTGVYLREKRL